MDLEALFPFVAPQVKACPDPTLIHHIRQALIEFCESTMAWQVALPEITTTANVDQYAMTLPGETMLVQIKAAALDGEPLEASGIISSTRGSVWTEDRQAVLITPQPEAGKKLALSVALRPSQAAATIEPRLFELYAKTIAHGALASLMDMPDVTWSNPMKALDRRQQFESGCDAVAAKVSKSNSRRARRVRPFTM